MDRVRPSSPWDGVASSIGKRGNSDMSDTARKRNRRIFLTFVFGGAALAIVIGIVQAPREAFSASLAGLEIWWQHVFPGLIPPLILAELLAASGMLHGLAVLAEPLTRSWFRLPGASGWAIAFGWTAGFPAGAKETARLRESGLIRDEHTDKALLVSHVPNPFLVVAIVGAGFLQSPALGWAIAAGVWLAAITAGVVWARVGTGRQEPDKPDDVHGPGRVRKALRAAAEARMADRRPLGKQLADAVTNTIGTLMSIGGLMMMAAVVIRLLQSWIPGSDAWIAIPGVYEMNLGAYAASRSPLFEAAPEQASALLAAALAWTGWSGLLQARAAFAGAGAFPWGRLIAGKLLQSALALLITWPIARFALRLEQHPAAWSSGSFTFDAAASSPAVWSGWRDWPQAWLAGLACLAVFLLLALIAALIRPRAKRRGGPPPFAK